MALIPALSGGGSEPIDWTNPDYAQQFSYTAQSADREEYAYVNQKPKLIAITETGFSNSKPRNVFLVYDVENNNAIEYVLGSDQVYTKVGVQNIISIASSSQIVFRVTSYMIRVQVCAWY